MQPSNDFRLCGGGRLVGPHTEDAAEAMLRLLRVDDLPRRDLLPDMRAMATRSAHCLRWRSYLAITCELAGLSYSDFTSAKVRRVSDAQIVHLAQSATGAVSGMSVILRLPSSALFLRVMDLRELVMALSFTRQRLQLSNIIFASLLDC